MYGISIDDEDEESKLNKIMSGFPNDSLVKRLAFQAKIEEYKRLREKSSSLKKSKTLSTSKKR